MSRSKTKPIVRSDSKRGRFYFVPEADGSTTKMPSVTTILSAINKPALVGWAANQERALVSETAADLYGDAAALPHTLPRPMYLLALQERLGKRKAHQKALEAAGEIGTEAHHMIEWTLKRELGRAVGDAPGLSDGAARAFAAWQQWREAVGLKVRLIEQLVWSRAHGYAGTLDLVADLQARALLTVLEAQGPVEPALGDWLRTRATVTAVVDFKTGKAIYREAHLQSVAYQRALAEMGHGRVDGGLIVRLPKTAADPGFEVGVVPPARDLFPVFVAVRQLWDWLEVGEAAYHARTAAAPVLTVVEGGLVLDGPVLAAGGAVLMAARDMRDALLAQVGPAVRHAAAAAEGVLAIETPAVRRAALVSLLAADLVELTGDPAFATRLSQLYADAIARALGEAPP